MGFWHFGMVQSFSLDGEIYFTSWCKIFAPITKQNRHILSAEIKKTVGHGQKGDMNMSQKIEHGFAVNTETGEVSDIYIQKDVSSQNFWKIWLSDILTVLGIISNSKQLDVVLYVMGHIKQSDNTFVGSYDKIAKEIGVSKRTVITTMKKLLEVDFIRRVQNGYYQVNPKYILKGNENKRRMVIDYYNTLDSYPKNDGKTESNEN